MKKSTKVLGVLLVLLGAVVSGIAEGFLRTFFGEVFGVNKNARIMEVLNQTSQRINQEGPRMVDSGTRLDRAVVGPGRKLTFYHTIVDVTVWDISEQQLQDAVGPRIREQACGREEIVQLLEDGVTITYRYKGMGGIVIGDIAVSEADC
jgi:hypothetical protein